MIAFFDFSQILIPIQYFKRFLEGPGSAASALVGLEVSIAFRPLKYCRAVTHKPQMPPTRFYNDFFIVGKVMFFQKMF